MRLASLLAAILLAAPAFAQGYVCAEGGGNPGKGAWADEVFGWMVEKGQRGHAVIIGAVALDAADLPDSREALFTRLGAKSCSSLVIDEKNADAQETCDAITAATIVFIRGGAQERYVNWWKGTRTEAAIHAVFDKGGVIAGTSAGCAILGEISYDSKNGSLKPLEALQDARHPHLTLTTDFLGLVPGVLFDTHFTERGRVARLPVMLAQVRDDLHRDDIIGIGVDPRTALCVEPDGKAEVRGEGAVTLIEFTIGTRTLLEAGKPPAVACALYSRLPAGTSIDVRSKRVTSDMRPVPVSDFADDLQPMRLDGRGDDRAVPPQGDEDKARAAPSPASPMVIWPVKGEDQSGLGAVRNTWAHASDLTVRAVQFLAISPGRIAFLLGPGNALASQNGRLFTVEDAKDQPPAAALVIDSGPQRLELAVWRGQVEQAWEQLVVRRQSAELDKRQRHILDVVKKHGRVDQLNELNKLLRKGLDDMMRDPADPAPDTTGAHDSDIAELIAKAQLIALLDRTAQGILDDEGRKALGDNPTFIYHSAVPMTARDEPELIRAMESDPNGMHPSVYRAKLHILPPGWSIDINTGSVTRPRPTSPAPPPP
jgi:cyanophycinase